MKKISRIRWLTTLMGLVVLMFTCAGCGQTAAQSNVPKPDASQSRVRIYESMVELEDDSPLIITGEISRTSVIRDIDDITDFTLLDVKVSQGNRQQWQHYCTSDWFRGAGERGDSAADR